MVAAISLATLLLASTISAKPVVERNQLVKLSLTRYLNLTATYKPVVHDQRRARALTKADTAAVVDKSLQGRASDSGVNSPAENQENQFYFASIGVGSPPTSYFLQVDSGSSNTWVGRIKPYVKTNTSHQTSNDVSVQYGDGSISGTEFTDQITIAPGLVIQNQSIGVASVVNGFPPSSIFNGILGIGPVGLTSHTLSPATESIVPTVTDNLFSTNVIQQNLVSVFFAPITTSGEQLNGELTWGGVNPQNFVGSITYTPITQTFPASRSWGIDITLNYGATALLANSPGIVDTGATLILLANDVFDVYQKATGATVDNITGFLTINSTQYEQLNNLSFIVSNVVFEFTPNAQIWPRILNAVIGGVTSKIYLVVTSFGEVTPGAIPPGNFVLGMTFLERFYSVYDTGNRRVGLAETPFTNAVSN